MAKAPDQNEVTIPISYAFEKRLAELVWENCPELARQTVAGKIAMAVEIDDQVVHSVMQHDVQVIVSACVKEQAAILQEQVKLQIDECLKGETDKAVRASVKRAIAETSISKEVVKLIRFAVNDEVHKVVVGDWVSKENKEVMDSLIEGRIDNYIYEHVK